MGHHEVSKDVTHSLVVVHARSKFIDQLATVEGELASINLADLGQLLLDDLQIVKLVLSNNDSAEVSLQAGSYFRSRLLLLILGLRLLRVDAVLLFVVTQFLEHFPFNRVKMLVRHLKNTSIFGGQSYAFSLVAAELVS